MASSSLGLCPVTAQVRALRSLPVNRFRRTARRAERIAPADLQTKASATVVPRARMNFVSRK